MSQYFWCHIDFKKEINCGVQQLLWLTEGDKRPDFLFNKIQTSAVDSVTPLAQSYIIYFIQLSCQSLFNGFIGRAKRLEMHKEAIRIFLSTCKFL